MFAYLLILTFILSGEARPPRPEPLEGEFRGVKGQRHFTFDNTKLKRSRNGGRAAPSLKYDVEFVEGFHSLDDEEEIEKIECTESALQIFSTTEEIGEWKAGDVVTGSQMWGCKHDLSRKIVSVQYKGRKEDLHRYYVKTTKAEMKDFFTHASVKFENEEDEIKKPEEPKQPENLKQVAPIIATIVSPVQKTVVDQKRTLYVEFFLSGNTYYLSGSTDFYVIITLFRKDASGNFVEENGPLVQCPITRDFTCSTEYDISEMEFTENNEAYVKIYFSPTPYITIDAVISDTFIVNPVKVAFVKPSWKTSVEIGQTIPISWDLTSTALAKYPKLPMHVFKVTGITSSEHTGIYYEVEMAKSYTMQIPSDSVYQAENTYFFRFDVEGHYVDSEPFTIITSNMRDIIEIVSPKVIDSFIVGDTINVEWDYQSELSFDTVDVYLMKRSVTGETTVVESKTGVAVSKKHTTFTVSSSFEPGSNYYIEINYEGEVEAEPTDSRKRIVGWVVKQLKRAASAVVAVFTEPSSGITVTSTSVDETNKIITVNYHVNAYKGTMHMKIYQNIPSIIPDMEVPSTGTAVISQYKVGSDYSQQFHYSSGSPFKIYFEVKHSCRFFGLECTTETTSIQDVPYVAEFGWNNNGNAAANREIILLQKTCENTPSMKPVCDAYNNWDFRLESICRDCYVYVPVRFRGFDLSIGLTEFYKMTATIQVDMYANFVIQNVFRAQLADVLRTTILPRIGIPILNIGIGSASFVVDVGVSVDFEMPIEATVFMQLVTSYNKHYRMILSIDTSASDVISLTKTDMTPLSQLTTTFQGSATVSIEPTLVPRLDVSMRIFGYNLLTIGAQTPLSILAQAAVQVPPFASDFSYCVSPHYVRVDLTPYFGISMDYQLLSGETKDIFNSKFQLTPTQSFGLLKTSSGGEVSVSFDMPVSTVNLDHIQMQKLAHEIGTIAMAVNPNYLPYNVVVIGHSDKMAYTASLIDSSASTDLVAYVSACVLQNSCPSGITITPEGYPMITKMRTL